MSTLANHRQVLRRVLWVVFIISLAGVGFSGTLTYRETIGSAEACPSPGAPGTIFGYPACVYGLIMYTVLAIASGWGLYKTAQQPE